VPSGCLALVNRFGQKTADMRVFELWHATRVFLLGASTVHPLIDARRRTT
jgi:hypothetical protein